MSKFIILFWLAFLTMNVTFSEIGLARSIPDSICFISTSDRVRLFLKVAGKGPVCIFVHGGPGMWSKSFETMGGNQLEQKLRMVYYDQRGSGRSESSEEKNYSIDRMVEDIEDIRITLKAKKIYLLSHSFGGIIAFNYAKKYPDHLKGLILLNSTLYLNNSAENQITHINKLIGTHFKIINPDSILAVFSVAGKALSDHGLEDKILSDRKETINKLDSIDNSFHLNRDFANHVWGDKEYNEDFTKETKNVKVPVLVITGKKDYAVGVDHYKLFHFPNQKVISIDGGHILYYEKNKAFIKAVFSFIE